MQIIRGDYGGKKTAIGYLKLCSVIRKRERAMKISAQKERLREALDAAADEISLMRKYAVESVGEEHGEIYGIYLKILGNDSLRRQLLAAVDNGASSEDAVGALLKGDTVAADGEFSSRHIKESLDLLTKVLEDIGCPDFPEASDERLNGSYIYVSDGMESGELIYLLRRLEKDNENIPVGVVCTNARELRCAVSREIPAILISSDSLPDESFDGATAILDCEHRRLIIDPDLSELEKYSRSAQNNEKRLEELSKFADLRSETQSGIRIRLFIEHSPENSGTASSCDSVPGADRGILCITDRIRADSPEGEQYEIYKRLAECRSDMSIRLFDLPCNGKDPMLFSFDAADSPLGLHGASLFALFRQVYKTQIKALLRAAVHGGISVVLPSVADRSELCSFRSILCEAKNELKKEGSNFADFSSLGVELTSPAAALSADLICDGIELAIIDLDRLISLTAEAELCDPIASDRLKSAVSPTLRLCSHAMDSAGANVRFAVRGNLAAEPGLSHLLIECGFKSFFIDPDSILPIKEQVLSYRGNTKS